MRPLPGGSGYTLWASELVDIAVNEDDALVVFEWLSELDVTGLERAGRVARDGFVAALERQLSAPFAEKYRDLLAAARVRPIEPS